jgi:prolyl oligopeptidase
MTTLALDDPYAYLEVPADPRTVAWTAAQNARTRAALDALPGRAALAARLDALLAVDVLGTPVARGARAFYTARRGEADQTVLYVREGATERALLDPIALDPSGLTAIDWWYPSPRGTYVAFGLSQDGSERSTLYVLDVARGERLGEAIPDTRYANVAWLPDETGFFYLRYPPGGQYHQRVYRHALGSDWAADPYVFGDDRKPEEMTRIELSPDGRWLVVTVLDGWTRNDAYVADTTQPPLRFVPLAEGRDALYDVRAGRERLYVRTNEGADRFRVFVVDPDAPERERWTEIVPEASGSLDGIAPTRNGLVLHYLEDARSVVRVARDGGPLETLAELGGRSVLGLSSHPGDETVFALHASYLEAPAIARVVVGQAASTVEVWERVVSPVDPSAYRVEQVWYVSNDGTRVPMTVVARADVARDGTAPAVLYGYGGFNISLVPSFMPTIVPWLDAGGVYAIANLRGGGEFGESWHRAGTRERKQNVFDDFIAAAEYLGSTGIAARERIAIMGGSNGGLLVAAVATQRPDLMRAVVCLVPLTDMLRFHEFLIARLWIAEYGDPDDPDDAAVLRAYSPYHRVRDGVAYPAMLVMTAESDTRVDPMHARKFAARVQAATSSGLPVYAFIEPNAGHGVGKPRRKVVAELADRWSFIADALGVTLDA